METIKEKRNNWLDSHLKVYLDDPTKRSIINNKCYYRHPENGNKCMIGQDIPDEKYSEDLEGGISKVLNILPESTTELGNKFLLNCQELHDYPFYWNENGLTEYGENKYNEIIKEYCN